MTSLFFCFWFSFAEAFSFLSFKDLFRIIKIEANSLDLIFNSDITTKKWFYGIQYILKNANKQFKINSATGYIILKLKMVIAFKLGKNTRDSHKLPFLKTILNYCKNNNIGY